MNTNNTSRQSFIDAIREAYELGSFCAKEVNSGRQWTKNKTERERAALAPDRDR